MKTLSLVIFLFLISSGTSVRAQLLRESMTAADVEKEVSVWYNSATAMQIFPDQNSMNQLHVKKVRHYMMMNYTGNAQSKAHACTKFDLSGHPLSSVEKDGPFWKSKKWSTHYTYENDGKVYIISNNPFSGIRTDSMTLNANGKVMESYSLESGWCSKYTYDEADGTLLQIISTDTSGGHTIKSFSYNDLKRIMKVQECRYDSLHIDTLLLVNVTRDNHNRILHYDYFSKYEFSYNMEDPTKIEYSWSSEDYEYDHSDRITMKSENNAFYKSPWRTTYEYENDQLKREARTTDSTVRELHHYWTGRRDSVAERMHFKNYLGRGPASINNGYSIIAYDQKGNCTEYTEYIYGFGSMEFKSRTIIKYDEQNRVVRRDFYEYDFGEKKIVYRTGFATQFYDNGLVKSFVAYGPNQKVQSTSRYKYHYNRTK